MALIIVRDTIQDRDRIINSDHIFHCFEHEGGVRIEFAEGLSGRDRCTIAGTLADFARRVGAVKAG
jgi:hypothetical protein